MKGIDLRPVQNNLWATLPLANGWDQWDTTNAYLPQYRKSADLIFTTGLARATIGNSSAWVTVAILPEGFRPNQIHQVIQWGEGGGRAFRLSPNGIIDTHGAIAVSSAIWMNYCFSL